MTAAILIRDLQATGIRLSVTGDRLHVEAKPGTVTPELRALLANRKADILAELTGIRGRLQALAEHHDIDVRLAHQLPQADVDACHGLPDGTLLAYLHTLADDVERHAGRVPAGDTAAVLCRSCGPVYLHPSIAAVLPVVAGWPRALGCPWCFVPKVIGNMAIPRPPVKCGACQHFIPNKINPAQGAGRCELNMPQRGGSWPGVSRSCKAFEPLNFPSSRANNLGTRT